MKTQKKVCVIGAGSWGINHIKTLDSLGALGGVVEKNQYLIKGISNRLEQIIANLLDNAVSFSPNNSEILT